MDLVDDESVKEYNLLITRAQSYEKCNNEPVAKANILKTKISNRNKTFILCELHEKKFNHRWNKECNECEKCICLQHETSLPNGKLPTKKQVLSYLFYYFEITKGQQHNKYADVASDLMLHWIFSNIYTIGEKRVKLQVKQLHESFIKLNKVPVIKRKNTFYERLQKFIDESNELFDIKVKCKDRLHKQEKLWGVKTSKNDELFYENMCKIPQVGSCSSFTDRKWLTTNKRKQRDKAYQAVAFEKSKVRIKVLGCVE